jgi:hypothetical protein
MYVKTSLLLPIVAVAIVAAPAHAPAATAITPALLVPRPGDVPGFAGVKEVKVDVARSAASFSEPGPKARTLERDGFREGADEEIGGIAGLLGGSEAGGVQATGALFRTARGARAAMKSAVAEVRDEAHDAERFRVPAIPGAYGQRESTTGADTEGRLLADGVIFSSGRCSFTIITTFNSAVPSSTPTRVDGAASAAAITLYRRDKRACSSA